mgnify:CR=1 FL=1
MPALRPFDPRCRCYLRDFSFPPYRHRPGETPHPYTSPAGHSYGEERENPTWLDVDNIILCAGQLPSRDLQAPLEAAGVTTYVIGGADVATELDAKRAIDQGSRLAAGL